MAAVRGVLRVFVFFGLLLIAAYAIVDISDSKRLLLIARLPINSESYPGFIFAGMCAPPTGHDLCHIDNLQIIYRSCAVDPIAAVTICCAGSVYIGYRVQIQPRKHVQDHADLRM